MTSHGFGGLEIESSKISPQQKAKFAKQVSKVKHVVKAHAVSCKTGRYDIIFEFEHLAKYKIREGSRFRKKEPSDLLKELLKIPPVDGHRIADSVDFCIIQCSYQRGKLIDEHEKPKI